MYEFIVKPHFIYNIFDKMPNSKVVDFELYMFTIAYREGSCNSEIPGFNNF